MSTNPAGTPNANPENGKNAADFGDIPAGALLRAAADDELGLSDRAAVNALLSEHPDYRLSVRFDQGLRRACARVMMSESVAGPTAEFRSRLTRSLGIPVPTPPVSVTHPASPRVAPPAPRRRRIAAWVAAALVFALGAGFLVQNLLTYPSFRDSPARAKAALVGFLRSEHRRCSLSDRARNGKMTVHELTEAPGKFQHLLGKPLSVGDVVAAGYEFLGAGRCYVPGSGASVHLIFGIPGSTPTAGSGSNDVCDPTKLSLFIQSDRGELPIVEGKTYRLDTEKAVPLVAIWRVGSLIYYLVTEDQAAEEKARKALGAPEGAETL